MVRPRGGVAYIWRGSARVWDHERQKGKYIRIGIRRCADVNRDAAFTFLQIGIISDDLPGGYPAGRNRRTVLQHHYGGDHAKAAITFLFKRIWNC